MSSASATLRRLRSADVALLRRLNALFGDAFGEQETHGGEPPTDAYLEELLGKEHIVAIMAMDGEEVIGGLVASPMSSTSSSVCGANFASMTLPWTQTIAAGTSQRR